MFDMTSLGFDKAKLEVTEAYLKAVKLFRNDEGSSREPQYSQVCLKVVVYLILVNNYR